MNRHLVLLCLLMLPLFLFAQDTEPPTLEGYITSVSGSDFEVNGWSIVTSAQTGYFKHAEMNHADAMVYDPSLQKTLAIGEEVKIFGKKDKKAHSIAAAKVVVQPNSGRLGGSAVIQRVIGNGPGTILEADGYYIVVSPQTTIRYERSLTEQNAPAPNLWVAYSGKMGKDGLLVADHIRYVTFALSPHEHAVMEKSKGTVVAPDFEKKTSGHVEIPHVIKADHKGKGSIPADKVLQQRIQTIGQRLIPKSQRELAPDDSQKIDFQFYAIDDKSLHGAIATQGGLVVIPVQVIDKLENDDQIAAVLADAMARILEWQMLTLQPKQATAGTMIAMGAMPFVGPLTSLALEGGGLAQMHNTGVEMVQQNERVSLSLMHDAGYDIHQAPRAWQLLSAKSGGGAQKAAPPPQSAYLLSIIGAEYSPAAMAAVGL